MADIGKPASHRKSHLVLALVGLLVSTGGVLLQEPLLTLSQKCPYKNFIFPLVDPFLIILIPLNFYLNILFLLIHITARSGASDREGSFPVFFNTHLPKASYVLSLAIFVLSAPVLVHAAIVGENIDFAIGGALLCVTLIVMLSSVFKKLFVARSFQPILFALFTSAGFLTLLLSDKNHHETLASHIPIHSPLLSFLCISIFMLGTILLILRIRTPADQDQGVIEVENSIVIALSVAMATLLVGGYLAAAIVKAAEL